MLSVIKADFYEKAHYAECHYAECHYAECHYAKCCGTLALSTFENTPQIELILIRKNQFPVSADRWQHGSQVCFATFIS
jgi:hypothetical protein